MYAAESSLRPLFLTLIMKTTPPPHNPPQPLQNGRHRRRHQNKFQHCNPRLQRPLAIRRRRRHRKTIRRIVGMTLRIHLPIHHTH